MESRLLLDGMSKILLLSLPKQKCAYIPSLFFMIIAMKTYIITRFSIFDYKHHAFKIQKQCNKDGYKSRLFSPKRLQSKFKVFEQMTLPSILGQKNKNWEWCIFSSAFLPVEFKERLIKLTEPHKQIRCKFIKSFDEFVFDPDDKDNYCTVRLDDDDGLAPNFIESLQKYREKKGHIVTHKNGITFRMNKGNVDYGEKKEYRLGGVGLAAIGMNIYHCGHHIRIGEKYKNKIICDDSENMFYLCSGEYCDSGRMS